MDLKSITIFLVLLLATPAAMNGQTQGDSAKYLNVVDYDMQDKPITASEVQAKEGIDNRLRMALICLPMSAEAGYFIFWPIAWCSGWAATGFHTDVQYDMCGCPTDCDPVINRPVFSTTLVMGTAGTTFAGTGLGYKLGQSLDQGFAIEEIRASRALQAGEKGKLKPTGIWYLSAGRFEFGYNNIQRYGMLKMAYIFPQIRIGFGLEGPSSLKYRGIDYASDKLSFFGLHIPFVSPIGLSLYVLPFYNTWKLGDFHFLNAVFLYGSYHGWAGESADSLPRAIDFGTGITEGTLFTLKGGAIGIPSLVSSASLDWKPYLTIEASLGSWFYKAKYKKKR